MNYKKKSLSDAYKIIKKIVRIIKHFVTCISKTLDC